MSLPLFLRPEARQDLEATQDYLDSQSIGLGQAFLERVKETFINISMMPEMYGVIWKNIRVARLRKFLYVVYYRIHDDRVEILAIIHGSRDPSVWHDRLD